MTRTEIIANRAIEEDLMEALTATGVAGYHTRIPGVHGIGNSGERRGDHVWPEENMLFLFYSEKETAERIVSAVREVKGRFPNEGIRLFQFEAEITEV